MAETTTLKCGVTNIPIVGLGTWQITDETELEKAFETALEVGYRHFDTAASYGNESLIGKVLKRWFDSGKLRREDIFLVTKLPIHGMQQDRVEHFIKQSLDSLQVKYVDAYLIHFPFAGKYEEDDPNHKLQPEITDHLSLWKKLEEQVELGRTKTIGLSNFSITQIDKILKNCRIKPACLQVELHLYFRQKQLVEFCHNNDIVVVSYGALGSSGYRNLAENEGIPSKQLPSILNDPVVREIATEYKKSSTQIILRFFVQMNIVVIPKSSNPSRIKENFQIWDFNLKEKDLSVLDSLDKGELGRIFDYYTIFQQFHGHPEFHFGGKPNES